VSGEVYDETTEFTEAMLERIQQRIDASDASALFKSRRGRQFTWSEDHSARARAHRELPIHQWEDDGGRPLPET